jgi:hypothetical protein
MSKIAILAEFWEFLRYRKKYWLAPIIIMLVALSALMGSLRCSFRPEALGFKGTRRWTLYRHPPEAVNETQRSMLTQTSHLPDLHRLSVS